MHHYAVAPEKGNSASSPTTTAYPQVLTPATSSTVNKPQASMQGMANQPPISINKQWVLPPKPKPGRKPAVDTPPTKRKAQNREAQRAFRERRAAKVGELEEQMTRMEEEDRKEQEQLRGCIDQLKTKVEEYSHLVTRWQENYREKERECGYERNLRQSLETEVAILRKGVNEGTEPVPLPPRFKRPGQNGYLEDQNTEKQSTTDHTCGNCTGGDDCKCVNDILNVSAYSTEDTTTASFKRPHSPPLSTNNKRSRQALDAEIDFTYQYTTPRRPILPTSASTSSVPAIAPPDPCGFCDDGTACICRELAKDQAFSDDNKPPPTRLPKPTQGSTNGAITSDPCVNGPGTCKQCLSDPRSTLFCKSVAANHTCVANGVDQAKEGLFKADGAPEPTLTCADAFTTLSRHPAFDQASTELGSWVPQLAVVRKPASKPDRTAYDIEAASVMSVLSTWDHRFGKDGKMNIVNGSGKSKTELAIRGVDGTGDGDAKS